MLKPVRIAVTACGACLLGMIALTVQSNAETATKSWIGPNGGTVHWRGDAVPGHYRGAVTVTTPDGDVYRRVTNAHRGPNGAYVTRRWVGPNGAAARRGGIRY